MITEDYVSYEISKLLKEKGFDWRTEFVWYEHLPSSIDWKNNANQKAIDYFYFNETTEHHSYYGNCDKKPSYINGDIYSAPTIQMALRWLKETHDFLLFLYPAWTVDFISQFINVMEKFGKKTFMTIQTMKILMNQKMPLKRL